MPTFIFNKLIRDKLKDAYEQMGEVALYKSLSHAETIEALKQKIIEETLEVPAEGSKDAMIAELADVQQAIDDLAKRAQITAEEITKAKQSKFEKKGGFDGALYVETLTLKDDDEWVAYYRQSPHLFKELGLHDSTQDPIVPFVEAGIYEHYKAKRYEVIGVGLDSETMKPVVVYVPLYKSTVSFWVRPYEMFLEFVNVEGKMVERFKKVNE